MSRIDGVPRHGGGAVARIAYRSTERQFGRMMEPVAVFAHVPRLLIGYGAMEKAFAGSQRVEQRLKNLAALKTATVVGCEFCIDIGSHEARASGLTDAQLLALPDYADSDLFSPLEKLVLDYAVAMTCTPTSVDDELFARMREHFDEPQLVELTFAIALENLRARFNWAFDIGPAGFSEGMVCAVPDKAAAAHAAGTASTA
jgi:AhpD family alkylhydroperoxidase